MTIPESGISSPAIILRIVVFPLPDAPRSTTISSSSTLKCLAFDHLDHVLAVEILQTETNARAELHHFLSSGREAPGRRVSEQPET
jgi:hypothetical protein